MPVVIAPLVGLLLGVGFAWVSADELGRSGGVTATSRSLLVVGWFGLLVYAPLTAYFVAFNPDWAYGFVINTARLPGVVDSAVVLAALAAPPIGFVIAARRAAEQRIGALLQLAAVPGVLTAAVIIVGFSRLAVQATYAQFHGDFGVEPIAGSRLGLSLLWMTAVLAGSVGWTAHGLRRIGRPRRRDSVRSG